MSRIFLIWVSIWPKCRFITDITLSSRLFYYYLGLEKAKKDLLILSWKSVLS